MRPDVPIMGNIIQLSDKEWAAWTGGKPKADWSGLDASAAHEYVSPNQLRPVYASSAQKGYIFRKTGLATKYKKGDDLQVFQKAILRHMVDTGMDTITYLDDPVNSGTMHCILTAHSRYTLDKATQLAKAQVVNYDKYDRTNDRAVSESLLDSFEVALRERSKSGLPKNLCLPSCG